MVPLLPRVTIFSATGRAALALASVVVTRLWRIKLHTRLASIALRCSEVRPNLAVFFKWRITSVIAYRRIFLRRGLHETRFEVHAEGKAESGQFVFDFVE